MEQVRLGWFRRLEGGGRKQANYETSNRVMRIAKIAVALKKAEWITKEQGKRSGP